MEKDKSCSYQKQFGVSTFLLKENWSVSEKERLETEIKVIIYNSIKQ